MYGLRDGCQEFVSVSASSKVLVDGFVQEVTCRLNASPHDANLCLAVAWGRANRQFQTHAFHAENGCYLRPQSSERF